MTKRSRNTIIVISVVAIFGAILIFDPFSSTEIIILDHLTEIGDDGVVNQICLVKNPPKSSTSLKIKIEQFDKKNPVKGKFYRRLFVKEHDNSWFAGWFLDDNFDYESKTASRDDINNIDFLGSSDYWPTRSGNNYKQTNIYTGEYWYYKY